jgi:hypothetical protein
MNLTVCLQIVVVPKLRMRGFKFPLSHISCWRGTYLQTDEDFSLLGCEMRRCVSDFQNKISLASNHQQFKAHSFENSGNIHPAKQLYFLEN